MTNPDLRRAFPDMPEECRAALLRGARSAKEEKPMKRKFPVALIAFALMLMMTTIAIAEGWSVLGFLNIQPDSEVSTLVQPVSAFAKEGDVSFRVESAVTDGEYLVFDWTVNNQGEKPAFFQLESYTANGVGIYNNSMNDDFDCHWHDDTMEGGTISLLPADLEGDTLHVEMVVGAYTPVKPVYEIAEDEDFDEVLAREKLDAGYFVRYGYNCWAIDNPDEGRVFAGWHKIQDAEAEGFTKHELVLRFDLDLRAGRASVRELELPEPVTVQGVTLAFTRATVSPLKLHLTAKASSAEGDTELIQNLLHTFGTTDILNAEGKELRPWDLCAAIVTGEEAYVHPGKDDNWLTVEDYLYFNPNEQMPDPFVLSYQLEAGQLEQFPDGLRIDLPISLK